MPKIVSINKNKTTGATEYKDCGSDNYEYIQYEGKFGIKNKSNTVSITPNIVSDEYILSIIGKGSVFFTRKELAELLWVSAILLDSEQKYGPENIDLIGNNYD